MEAVIYFTIVIMVLALLVIIPFKLYMAQRRSRFARVFLDGLGLLVILPTIAIAIILMDFNAPGGSMSGLGAFVIYSVVSLGIVPLLTIGMAILSARLVRRTFGKRIFS